MTAYEILGLGPNATLDEVKQAYRRKIKDLNDTDINFENKLNMYHEAYTTICDGGDKKSKGLFDDFFRFYNPFKMINNASRNMMKDFDMIPSGNVIEDNGIDQPISYTKYVSNYTSISNGKKQSNSVSTVEQIVNGQKQIARKRVFDDSENIITEKTLPNGKKETKTYKKPTMYKIKSEKIE